MTSALQTVPRHHRAPPTAWRPFGLEPVELLFVLAAVIAPLNLFVLRSLTVYDVAVATVACLLVVTGRGLEPVPRVVAVTGCTFLVAALVSTFRASVPAEAFTQTTQFAFNWFVLLPVVLTMARRPRVLRGSLIGVVVGSAATVVWAMASPVAQGADRFLISFSDNPNRLGYPSAYLAPFLAYAVARLWRRGHRLAALAVGVASAYVGLWALGASGSRGATVAALVALVTYAALRPQVGLREVAARLLLTAAGTVAAVLLVTRSGLFPVTLVDRVVRTFDPAERASLLQDRESLALAGLRAFVDSPLVGTGLDNFRYLAPRYADGTTLQAPHNLWIQFLAQVGLIGTVAFAWFVIWWFRQMIASYRSAEQPREGDLAWAFVAAAAALMTIHMTTPIFTDRHYWLLLGLGLALALGREARTATEAAGARGLPAAPVTPGGAP